MAYAGKCIAECQPTKQTARFQRKSASKSATLSIVKIFGIFAASKNTAKTVLDYSGNGNEKSIGQKTTTANREGKKIQHRHPNRKTG